MYVPEGGRGVHHGRRAQRGQETASSYLQAQAGNELQEAQVFQISKPGDGLRHWLTRVSYWQHGRCPDGGREGTNVKTTR